jgi:hypothetical protein
MLFCKKKPDIDTREIIRLLFQVLNNQEVIIKKENKMSVATDNLTNAVANITVTISQTVTLLQTLLADIEDPTEEAKIQAQVDLLNAQNQALIAANVANQPPALG